MGVCRRLCGYPLPLFSSRVSPEVPCQCLPPPGGRGSQCIGQKNATLSETICTDETRTGKPRNPSIDFLAKVHFSTSSVGEWLTCHFKRGPSECGRWTHNTRRSHGTPFPTSTLSLLDPRTPTVAHRDCGQGILDQTVDFRDLRTSSTAELQQPLASDARLVLRIRMETETSHIFSVVSCLFPAVP
jgi:hypothetical protein